MLNTPANEATALAKIGEVVESAAQRIEADRCEIVALKDRAWELECALRDLLRDESERRAIGGGPGWKERHAKSWTAAFELFEGQSL